MDDAQLWDEERKGAPVSHCRAKIEADRLQLINRRNQAARRQIERRRIGSRRAA